MKLRLEDYIRQLNRERERIVNEFLPSDEEQKKERPKLKVIDGGKK